MADELRERAPDDLLIRATVALHDLDCSPDCGDSLTTMDSYARQAQAVLAALDLGAREAAAREEGRREAADLLDSVAWYLAVGHRHAGYAHDHLGENLSCAGCKLLARVEAATERGQGGEGT